MTSGQVLRVIATDPGLGVRHGGVCRANRQPLAGAKATEGSKFVFFLKKA
jgi:TusA-related sulfurtransferase